MSDRESSTPPEESSPESDPQPDSSGAETIVAETADVSSFQELDLSEKIVGHLNSIGFTKPTPIQALLIPKALTGVDVMGQAKTGTGKTAAFLLPIFQKLTPHKPEDPDKFCQALILAPTRELALQIYSEVGRLGGSLGFSSITLYGGASYEPQIEALSAGVDIVVGTPGRIMDHMRSHRLDLSHVKVAVLDEADRMLDLGFRKDIEYILRHCPEQRQTLLLSATIPDEIRRLAKRFMYEPTEIYTSPENLTVDTVEQHFFVCQREDKFPILLKLLDQERPPLAIVFCGTKIGAKKLTEKLKRLHISAREIHGDLQQSKREKILGRFRTGHVRLLIATDVASRGIDVQNITHIFNYDIPYKIEDYVHRIGRTGRIGRSGKAYTFVTREEGSYLTEIELLINKELKRKHFDDLTSIWWPNPPKEPVADFYVPEVSAPQTGDEAAPPGSGKRKRRRRGRRTADGQEAAGPAADTSVVLENTVVSASAEGAEAAVEKTGEEGRRPRRRRRKPSGEPVTITCSQCGATAVVHFQPKPDRPIYCPNCYESKRASKAAATPEVTPETGVAPSE